MTVRPRSRPTPRPGPADPYVRFAGDQTLGRYTVVASLGIYGAITAAVVVRTLWDLNAIANERHASAYNLGRAMGGAAGVLAVLFVLFVGIPAVLTGICWAAVWVASKVARFKPEPVLVVKVAAVVCAPVAVHAALAGFHVSSVGDFTPSLWLIGVVGPIVLWLVLRLRAVPYLITLGLVLAVCVGPPLAIAGLLYQANHDPIGRLPGRAAAGAGNGSESAGDADQQADTRRLQEIGRQITAWADGLGHGYSTWTLDELVYAGKLSQADLKGANRGAGFQFESSHAKAPFPAVMVLVYDFMPRPNGVSLMLMGDGRVEVVPRDQRTEVMYRSSMASHGPGHN